eukprot:PITA_09252
MPQENGVSERMNMTIMECARGPSSSLDGAIPEEAWTGKKVNYSFLKTFGCEAFVHFNKENRTKLEAKSKKFTFIGYGVNNFGYHFYDYEKHKITRSRNVIFNEKVLYKDQMKEKKQEKENREYSVLDEIIEKVMVPGNHNDQQPEQEPQQQQALQTPESGVIRSIRMSRPPERYSPSLYYVFLTDSSEPECYEEAM